MKKHNLKPGKPNTAAGIEGEAGLSTQDKDTIRQLQEELDKLEHAWPVATPDLHWFERQLSEHHRMNTSRLIRDLVMFWLVAVVILSMSFAAYMLIPSLFLIVQILMLAVIPIALSRTARKWWSR